MWQFVNLLMENQFGLEYWVSFSFPSAFGTYRGGK